MVSPSVNRGIRGRKKLEGTLMSVGTNGGSSIPDLSWGSHESPPRGADDTAESDTSSVASSLLHEDFSLFPEQW